MQNTAGGTADDSDAAETSNEHGRTARERDGSNVASMTYWQYAVALALVDILAIRSCACTGEARPKPGCNSTRSCGGK